ncbi:MAG: InlB B-repeat-containing protein, partial [Flavobacteriales bacterium]|nr:InlB B-repeat-containing protein [Flavobacteriales bacterium]
MTINGTNVGSGTIPTTGAAVGNTAVSGMTGLTGTVTIVISLSGATGTGTFRLDDFTLFGSTSCGGSSHTVTFNGNGNDGGSMSNQTASGSTALTTNAFTKTGCSFTVWNTASDGSGTSYTNGATYDFSADITLYAQWNCSPPTGGNCMDEDFVDFSDWTNYGTATDNDASHYGANGPCRALGTGDNLESPSVDNPTQLQFYQDASSAGSGSTATVKYSLDGGTTWVACYSFTVSSSGATETVDLTNVGGVDLSAETGVIFQFSSSFNTWYLDDVSVTCGTPAPNTITTGSITGSPFSIQCATNDNGSVAFISTDVYGAGNIYTAQLSDASGSFSFPVNIGTLTSTANSGTINITIPAGTPSGSNYKIRVISSNPYIVGSASSAFTITLTDGPCAPPHITSVLFNGCDPAGCGGEGRSEMVFANTGVNSVLVNSSNLDLIYPGSPPYDLLGSIVSNASTITTMNDSAACGTLFYDANGQTVPPNTTLLLVSSDICAEINFDWSSLCGSGPIYVVFGQSGTLGDTWHDSGNFGNSSGTKTFDLDITATDAITYGYTYS